MKTVSIVFFSFSLSLISIMCPFKCFDCVRHFLFTRLLHNKEADRRLLCSQMAHYLVINLTKASPPRSTESTCSAAPLPVITKHAFLICRPRVRVHKQFALRKVLRWFWILIQSWLMHNIFIFFAVNALELHTLRFWALSQHVNIRCIHLLEERQRRPLIRVAWRGEGLHSCGIHLGLPQIF